MKTGFAGQKIWRISKMPKITWFSEAKEGVAQNFPSILNTLLVWAKMAPARLRSTILGFQKRYLGRKLQNLCRFLQEGKINFF